MLILGVTMHSSCFNLPERLQVVFWQSTQIDICDPIIKTQILEASFKNTFDKWIFQGASTPWLPVCTGVSVNVVHHETNWHSPVSKVVCFYYSLPLCKSHLWYLKKQHLAYPPMKPWHLSFIILAPPGCRMSCYCSRLWMTLQIWATVTARAQREHKWTGTSRVKTTRTKPSDNIVKLWILYRIMSPPKKSMWLMHGTCHVIPHVLFKTPVYSEGAYWCCWVMIVRGH